MEGIEVPSFFLCPISFQIMRDPVTLPTGITYDRHSIDRWLFADNHDTCPITKVPLPGRDRDRDLLITPNHTLRRLIQAWCATNTSVPDGIERFPSPRPPIDRAHVAKLIDEARSHPQQQPLLLLASLRKLKSIVGESDRNRSCVESSGAAVGFLASVVEEASASAVVDEALGILHSLQMSEQRLVDLVGSRGDFVDTLTAVLQRSSHQSRAYASLMLKSLMPVLSSAQITGLKQQLFVEMVKVLKDRISYQATKAALRVLSAASPWGRNKVKAVEAGAVPVLIDLLLDAETEKKGCEMVLVVLSRLSECAEGRAEVVGHAAGVAAVSRKLVRVSVVATERAVRIVHSVAKFSPTAKVLREMLELGVVSKLCLLVQVDCGKKTKDRVKEILRLHSRVWRNSPCISPQLHTSYPA